MASMKEIREHIASIQSTQKVTNGMVTKMPTPHSHANSI